MRKLLLLAIMTLVTIGAGAGCAVQTPYGGAYVRPVRVYGPGYARWGYYHHRRRW